MSPMIFFKLVKGIPFFHTVNDYDLYGNTCSLARKCSEMLPDTVKTCCNHGFVYNVSQICENVKIEPTLAKIDITEPNSSEPSTEIPFSFNEPIWFAFFSVVAVFLVSVFIFSVKNFKKPSKRQRFSFYKTSGLGTLSFTLFGAFSMALFAILSILVYNLNLESHFLVKSNSSEHFILFWHAMFFVLVAWKAIGIVRTRCFFKKRADPKTANIVKISTTKTRTRVPKSALANVSKFSRILMNVIQKVEEKLSSKSQISIANIRSNGNNRYFIHDYDRYVYDPCLNTFEPKAIHLGTTVSQLMQLASNTWEEGGLAENTVHSRISIVGFNRVEVQRTGFFKLLADECTGWFYIYQFTMLWVWYAFQYYKMGLLLTLCVIFAALRKTAVKYRAHKRIYSLSCPTGCQNVLRNSNWTNVPTDNLVPGDLMEISNGTVPVDLLLFKGNVVVNEGSLTGECRPIRKGISHNNVDYDKKLHARQTIFAGSEVLHCKNAFGLVLTTGASTSKGTIIRNMLNPEPFKFLFDEQFKVVFVILLCWAIFCVSFVYTSMGFLASTWFYAMFMITETISPVLPSMLIAGQSLSSDRLRKECNIFCSDLSRITIAGKTKIFCFDKTGTLTNSGQEMLGFICNQILLKRTDLDNDSMEILGLSTCHSLSLFGAEIVGNPVDEAMFKFTEHQLNEDDSILDSTIVKRFEFDHKRSTMGSIVHRSEQLYGFVKGSPEAIERISHVPNWYTQVAEQHSKLGAYVLGLAYKPLDSICSRDELESGLLFLGFIILQNILKPDSTSSIAELHHGSCSTVMITGDSLFTAMYIADQCNIAKDPFYAMLEGDAVVWRHGDEIVKYETVLELALQNKCHLAVTGTAWEVLRSHGKQILLQAKVFARMEPSQKAQVVRMLMNHGIVGMCGDGGNDCMALSAAHVGIALCGSEASVAAPFSTNSSSIFSCVDLVREGRGALASSFAGYKFLVMYGMSMSVLCLPMFYFSAIPNEYVWITIDGVIVVVSSFLLLRAKAVRRSTKSALSPYRPTVQLLGAETVCSILLQTITHWAIMIAAIVLLFRQSWFICNEWDSVNLNPAEWWKHGYNYEASVIAVVVLVQFLTNGAIYNFGHDYRESWHKNYFYAAFYIFMLMLVWSTIFFSGKLSCLFGINCSTDFEVEGEKEVNDKTFETKFAVYLWFLTALNVVLAFFWEKIIVLGPIRRYLRARRNDHNLRV